MHGTVKYASVSAHAVVCGVVILYISQSINNNFSIATQACDIYVISFQLGFMIVTRLSRKTIILSVEAGVSPSVVH